MGLAHTFAVDTEAALRRSNLGSTWRLPFTRSTEWVDRCFRLRCGSKVSDDERSGDCSALRGRNSLGMSQAAYRYAGGPAL